MTESITVKLRERLAGLERYQLHPKSLPAVKKALGDIENAIDAIREQIDKSTIKVGRAEWDWPETWVAVGEIDETA